MNKYTIYCTKGQTRKALELGAPIFTFSESFADDCRTSIHDKYCSIPPIKEEGYEDEIYADIPTAEQMIGWLEENGILDIVISRRMSPKTYGYTVWFSENTFVQEKHSFNSRREATLVAITVALEHLENNKQQTL